MIEIKTEKYKNNGFLKMIIRTLEGIRKPTETVEVYLLDGYDVVEGPDGRKGFGVFVTPEENGSSCKIYIPLERQDERSIIETLAHEYLHFVQYVDNIDFSEKAAEEFADEVLKKCKNKKMISMGDHLNNLKREIMKVE